ncbi:MAG: glycosyltransferase family 4 protein [Alphaproteobacteria bacterium]|nr:glycosyltransferase family 4 protein [Alphaproteobacteria bacterium]
MARPLSALVLSPRPDTPGGVAAFAETMKANFSYCRVTSLPVGQKPGEKENIFAQAKRLITLPLNAASLARKGRFDVVHINPSLNPKSLIRDGLILLMLRLARFRRVLVSFHGWRPETEAFIRRTPFARAVFAWLLNGVGRITVLSPAFRNSLQAIGVKGDRIAVTSTMFDGTTIRTGATPSASPRKTILFMSRFKRAKGVYELVGAFARLAEDFPDFDLVMAGDGKEDAALREITARLGLEKRIIFPGYLQGAAKEKALQDCSIFALPTSYPEGMPVALLEAMAAGKPLLTAKAGGIRHIVAEPSNGIVLDEVTIDTVADGLRRLLRNPGFCEESGARNAVYAWQNFEARAVTAKIEVLYREIAQLP